MGHGSQEVLSIGTTEHEVMASLARLDAASDDEDEDVKCQCGSGSQ